MLVVMGFDSPHIGVQKLRLQAVAIGLCLGIHHQRTQLIHTQFLLGAGKNSLFKEEAGCDVYDHLLFPVKTLPRSTETAPGVQVGPERPG